MIKSKNHSYIIVLYRTIQSFLVVIVISRFKYAYNIKANIALMSSNNLDEKLLLQYISKCFHNWGLTYATPDVLRRSKKNQDQAIKPMIRLLFDLCILHIFHYKHSPQSLAIDFAQEQQMLQVILAHLFQAQCPLVIVKEEQSKTAACFDFTSSKYLLLACGWVMAVSNFFSQTIDMLFKQKFQNIYKPKPLNFTALSQKYANAVKDTNLHHQSDKLSRVAYLAKILKGKRYSIECLVNKKSKIFKKLKEQLKNIDGSLNIEDIFSSANPEQIEYLEKQLRQVVLFQKQNMGFRKYWWIWLDQKIIASEYSQLPTQYQYFEKKEVPPESIKYNISIDLEFVGKYVQLMHSAQEKLQSIQKKITELQIKGDKMIKQIERDIMQEIRSTIQQSKSRQDDIPSFIGMQLQKYMKLYQTNTSGPKQSKKALDKAADKSMRKLQGEIQSFIEQIDQIIIM